MYDFHARRLTFKYSKIPTLTPTHSDPPPKTGKPGNAQYGLGQHKSPAGNAHRPIDRSTPRTAPRTPARQIWVMKQRLRTFNALLTLALLHQNKPPPQYTRDRTPTAREVNTRPPPRGVSEAQGTPTPAHTNRAHVTGHPAGGGTRDPLRQPYNATEEKTFNNLCSKQPPNEKCYFIRHQPYHLFAISTLKPFFRTRVLRTKITNTTDPWVMLDYRNMNMVILGPLDEA